MSHATVGRVANTNGGRCAVTTSLDLSTLRAIVTDDRDDTVNIIVTKGWLKLVHAALEDMPHMHAELAGLKAVDAVRGMFGDGQ